MSYEISFWDIVRAWFVPFKLGFLAIPLGIIILAILVVLRLRHAGISVGMLLCIVGFFMVAVLGPLVGFALVYKGSGARIENARLLVKIGTKTTTIMLENAVVSLVDSGGVWEATLRKNGIGLPGFSAGWFSFRNGKTALYLRHTNAPYRLVLKSGETYYVLVFPGVEKFYQEILSRGAKAGDIS